MTFKKYEDRERVKAAAHNVAMIGAEDVMLKFEFPKEWGVNFSSNQFIGGSTVYVDLTIDDAIKFGLNVLEAALEAKRIWAEYEEYARNEMKENDT